MALQETTFTISSSAVMADMPICMETAAVFLLPLSSDNAMIFACVIEICDKSKDPLNSLLFFAYLFSYIAGVNKGVGRQVGSESGFRLLLSL